MKLLIDNKIPFLTALPAIFEDIRYFDGPLTRCELGDTDVLLVRTRTRCNAGLLEGSAVKFIGTATIGTDHIDMDYCRSKGITVVNAAGCNAPAVMQYVVRALFELAHRRNKAFSALTLGVVGAGHVGSLVATAAEALGMRVLLNDPPRAAREGQAGFTGLHALLEQSDAVTLHVPLQDDTRGFANDSFFEKMQEGAAFINTSRGEAVDEDSLLRYRKKLDYIVLDVWNREPHINIPLLQAADIATFHIAGYSLQGKRRASEMVTTQLLAWYKGERVERVKGERVERVESIKMKDENELYLVINKTFPIFEVDKQLRQSPADFEQLRNNYPLRNDFSAYTVALQQPNHKPEHILRTLGFQV